MSVNVPDDRPPIDPYPLSPYVAWAGNRNRDPILGVFKELSQRAAMFSNSRAARATT